MYHALLTRKYLTSKVIPLLSVAAVTLCTAMVLITWSVMGGFLAMLLSKGQTLVGDVSIVWPNVGFGYYDDLIKRLEDDKEYVAAATPIIEAPGLVELAGGRIEIISLRGIDGPSYTRVVDFEKTLWWKPVAEPVRKDVQRLDPRLCDVPLKRVEEAIKGGLGGYTLRFMLLRQADARSEKFLQATKSTDAKAVKGIIDELNRAGLSTALADALAMTAIDKVSGKREPAVVPGIELLGLSRRQPEQFYTINDLGRATPKGEVRTVEQFAPEARMVVRVLPMDKNGNPTSSTVSRRFPVANEYRTEVYDFDRRSMLVDLKSLQEMMRMDAAVKATAATNADATVGANGQESFGEVVTGEMDPARVTTVLVKAAAGVSPEKLQARCAEIYEQFAAAHPGEVPAASTMRLSNLIQTWGQRNAQLVGAVQHETVLVLGMLMLISFCATFLILAIFWAMVAEKTKDIGILRSIGASRVGVAWLWLRYGIIIGVVGSLLGLGVSYSVITNINEIHDWLGRTFGIAVWDPKVYYFSTIPNTIVWSRVVFVVGGGVVFSVLGALVPALRAAMMDPVRALRFE